MIDKLFFYNLALLLKRVSKNIHMKLAKLLGFVILSLSFSQCRTTKFDKNPPFTILKTTFNNWVGGQPGVSGTKVKVTYKSDTEVHFIDIYFNNRKTKVEQHTNTNQTYLVGHFSTSKREDLTIDINPNKEINNTIPAKSKLPFEIKENEVVLSYKIRSKIKYFKITQVKKTDTDFYQ